MHNVVALVVPDVIIFDLAIPAEIFGRAVEHGRYAFTVCTEQPGAVRSTSGFNLEIGSGLDAMEGADTVIVPGFFPRTDLSPVVIAALRRASARGARVASVCVGAFPLAAAGLLDGRNATTHWEFADELAARFPAVRVTPEVHRAGGQAQFSSWSDPFPTMDSVWPRLELGRSGRCTAPWRSPGSPSTPATPPGRSRGDSSPRSVLRRCDG
jgi:transcriptional regulator GlxA family with amidase domain